MAEDEEDFRRISSAQSKRWATCWVEGDVGSRRPEDGRRVDSLGAGWRGRALSACGQAIGGCPDLLARPLPRSAPAVEPASEASSPEAHRSLFRPKGGSADRGYPGPRPVEKKWGPSSPSWPAQSAESCPTVSPTRPPTLGAGDRCSRNAVGTAAPASAGPEQAVSKPGSSVRQDTSLSPGTAITAPAAPARERQTTAKEPCMDDQTSTVPTRRTGPVSATDVHQISHCRSCC